MEHLIDWIGAGNCPSRQADPDYGGCYQNVNRARMKGVTLAGRTRLAGVALRERHR